MYKIYFNILLFLPLLSFSQEKNITDELSIGKYYQGGIIGYILQDGDIGYDPKVRHGIIVSTEDQSDGIRWYNGISTLSIIGARGSSVGYGSNNTELIIKNNGINKKKYAAGIATLYRGGGFQDWFLPSIDELNKLYINKSLFGLNEGWYWSSTEGDNFSIWYLDFKFGFKELTRHNSLRVRAVRKF